MEIVVHFSALKRDRCSPASPPAWPFGKRNVRRGYFQGWTRLGIQHWARCSFPKAPSPKKPENRSINVLVDEGLAALASFILPKLDVVHTRRNFDPVHLFERP
jgi:hypothetical protein